MVGEELVALFIKLMRSGSQEDPGTIELDHVTKPFNQQGGLVYFSKSATSGSTKEAVNITGQGTLEWIMLVGSANSELRLIIDGATIIDKVVPQDAPLPLVIEYDTSLYIRLEAGGAGGCNIYGVYRTK